MAEYRTEAQFNHIIETMHNGNWTMAADICVVYGFYAVDLLNALEADDSIEENDQDWCTLVSKFVTLAEMAQKHRGNAEVESAKRNA